MFAIDDFGRPSRRASSLGPTGDAAVLGEEVEDRRRAGDRRGERIALSGWRRRRFRRCSRVPHRSLPPPSPHSPNSANLLNRVPYLDSAYPLRILSNLPPSVQHTGRRTGQ